MKLINIYYRILSSFSIVLGTTVVLDTFVLKQFLKNLMVKANTSSYSPYNSDGVLNLIIIFVLLIAIPILLKILGKKVGKDTKE